MWRCIYFVPASSSFEKLCELTEGWSTGRPSGDGVNLGRSAKHCSLRKWTLNRFWSPLVFRLGPRLRNLRWQCFTHRCRVSDVWGKEPLIVSVTSQASAETSWKHRSGTDRGILHEKLYRLSWTTVWLVITDTIFRLASWTEPRSQTPMNHDTWGWYVMYMETQERRWESWGLPQNQLHHDTIFIVSY